jgi:3-oxoacyl-[acyl-carrier protein] reductase
MSDDITIDGTSTDARSFSGKVALVVGGSRGIGAAVVRRFAALGTQVAIGYRARGGEAAALAAELAGHGARAQAFTVDVSDQSAVESMINRVVAELGRIDVLVNTAGINPYVPLGRIDPNHVRSMFDVNVLGTVLLTQAVIPHLPSPGGRIIHFSSRLATAPIPTTSVYAASKAAVATLVHAFAKELGPSGITINAIAPGVIETEMTSAILRDRGDAILAGTPLGRIGKPEDIAGIVTFLASPQAGWITGRTILADGGAS